jgi:hypothetical protein
MPGAFHFTVENHKFSGYASTSDLLMSARKQGRDFQVLAKPIHPVDLLAAIRGLWFPNTHGSIDP